MMMAMTMAMAAAEKMSLELIADYHHHDGDLHTHTCSREDDGNDRKLRDWRCVKLLLLLRPFTVCHRDLLPESLAEWRWRRSLWPRHMETTTTTNILPLTESSSSSSLLVPHPNSVLFLYLWFPSCSPFSLYLTAATAMEEGEDGKAVRHQRN